MGTRGLVFIRCRGKYFVYYNQFDSYPEGLGEAIVQQIPGNPEKYHGRLNWTEGYRYKCMLSDSVLSRMARIHAQSIHRICPEARRTVYST